MVVRVQLNCECKIKYDCSGSAADAMMLAASQIQVAFATKGSRINIFWLQHMLHIDVIDECQRILGILSQVVL